MCYPYVYPRNFRLYAFVIKLLLLLLLLLLLVVVFYCCGEGKRCYLFSLSIYNGVIKFDILGGA